MRFCPECGALLTVRELEHRPRVFCPQCERVYYEQLKVGAGAWLEREGRLLLLRRAREPFKHCWNLPAGYVEADESPIRGVVREVREETGLQVVVEELVDVYFFADDPRGNGILIVYRCRPTGGELIGSEEGTELTFFAPDEMPAALAGGGHDRAIRAWQERFTFKAKVGLKATRAGLKSPRYAATPDSSG